MFDLKSPTKMFLCTYYIRVCIYIYMYTHIPSRERRYGMIRETKITTSAPLVLWSSGPLGSGPVVPADFASFPVENLLIYQPSTATFLQAASLDPLHNNMVNPDLMLESEGEVLAISGSGHGISHVKLVSAGSQQQNDVLRERDVHLVHVLIPSEPSCGADPVALPLMPLSI